jgi:organic radical activating enzyme
VQTSTVRISEIFRSIQGEGPSAGVPAHFVRLQGCDVGCHWCDSKYTWAADGGEGASIADLLDRARALGPAPMVVVTGGEPLQHEGVVDLLRAALEHWSRVEVETSGVQPPPLIPMGRRDSLHEHLFYNVSPKLPAVTPRWADTWVHAGAWVDEPRATFKIVIGDARDVDDTVRLLGEHRVPPARVMLMPEGLTDDQVRGHSALVSEACMRFGFRLSPRLHIWMHGPRRGV